MGKNRMKIAVLSGKGGAGKTMVSVNLAAASSIAVYLDCDVEEPNGYLFFKPQIVAQETVTVRIPVCDQEKCNGCRTCVEFCKFNALAYVKDKLFVFDTVCHACGGCVLFCEQKALSEQERPIGKIQTGTSGNVQVVTGILDTGEESGVPIIRKIINEPIVSTSSCVVIDCPPGSGCSVMESIRDADYCVLVAEPTIFGAHNLEMVYELTQIYGKSVGVVLNKCMEGQDPSEMFCNENGLRILERIPFDREINQLNSDGRILVRENQAYLKRFRKLLADIEKEVHL